VLTHRARISNEGSAIAPDGQHDHDNIADGSTTKIHFSPAATFPATAGDSPYIQILTPNMGEWGLGESPGISNYTPDAQR
jgi:hypothetical protein